MRREMERESERKDYSKKRRRGDRHNGERNRMLERREGEMVKGSCSRDRDGER